MVARILGYVGSFGRIQIKFLCMDEAWISVGDFNSVLSADQVSFPENWYWHRSSAFLEWIFRQGLIDMGFSCFKYTRTRGNHPLSFKGAHRLDRAFYNLDCNCLFPEAVVTYLFKVKFHSPILVGCNLVIKIFMCIYLFDFKSHGLRIMG